LVDRNSSSLLDMVPLRSRRRGNSRFLRQHRSSIVNKAFEAMGRHIQGGVIDRGLIHGCNDATIAENCGSIVLRFRRSDSLFDLWAAHQQRYRKFRLGQF
jgi:hypothetical protein